MSKSKAVPMEGAGLHAPDEQSSPDDKSFRRLYFSLAAKRFNSRWVWIVLTVAVVLNLAKHLWLSGQLQRLSAPRAVIVTADSLDFLIVCLVFVMYAQVEKLRRMGTLEALRVAGCSWKEIWRPAYLILRVIFIIDAIFETAVVVLSSYEPYFSDWWIWISALVLSIPLCFFAASSLVLLNALRLPRGLQIILLGVSAFATMAALEVLTNYLDSFLSEHFWPSALVQRLGALITGQTESATPYFTSWLLHFRTTTLLSYLLGAAGLSALTILIQAITPWASERRLMGS